MIISSEERFALIQENNKNEEKKLFELLEIFGKQPIQKCDLIIIEGFKNENIPKLEIHRSSLAKPLLFEKDSSIFAIASDQPIKTSLPIFNLNDINGITNYIIQKFKIS